MSAAALIDCPRCASKAETQRALERHLVEDHLLQPPAAKAEAFTAATGVRVDVEGRCRTCHRHVVIGVAHTSSCLYVARTAVLAAAPAAVTPAAEAPPSEPTAPKETPMADTKACEKCKKPFSPTSDRQRHCDECAVCGFCKGPRVAHKAWCKYGGKKAAKAKRAPKKSAARTSKVSRRHSEPAVPANGHEPDRAVVADARVLLRTKVEEQLIDARAEVRALERLLAATE